MKTLLLLLCLALPLSAAEPVAVVELFTSEGCSSCPPADQALAQLAGQKGVLPLAFHVDYWNNLGWPDPFSRAEFSQRQSRYSRAFKTDQVYTPQMIVNGQVGFNGSDRARAAREIEQALQRPLPVSIAFTSKKVGSQLQVHYQVEAPAGSVVQVLQVRPSASVQVPRGENAGRTLAHTNIVLRMVSGSAGDRTVSLPDEPGSYLVLLVQDSASMKILGAARA